MSKSVIVIDTPESCSDCPCCSHYDFGSYCEVKNKELEYDYEKIIFIKPEWCPLIPLPERKDISHLTGHSLVQVFERQYKKGYNDCLSDLKGGNL